MVGEIQVGSPQPRLSEMPLRQRGEIIGMPGNVITITLGPKNNTIIDIIRLPL